MIKWAWRESDKAPSSTTKVKNEWSFTSTPLICLHCVDTKRFTCFDLHQTVDNVQVANNLKCDAPSPDCCGNLHRFYFVISQHPMIRGFLSPLHGAPSGCWWRNGFQCGGQLRIYWIRSRGQPTRDGPPAWGLGEVLTTPHRRNISCYEQFTKASDLDWYCGAT